MGRVERGNSAYKHGINVNDEIIAVDNYRVADNDLNTLVKYHKAGDEIVIAVSRDGIMMDIRVKLSKDTKVNYRIVPIKSPTEKQQLIYKKWLSE